MKCGDPPWNYFGSERSLVASYLQMPKDYISIALCTCCVPMIPGSYYLTIIVIFWERFHSSPIYHKVIKCFILITYIKEKGEGRWWWLLEITRSNRPVFWYSLPCCLTKLLTTRNWQTNLVSLFTCADCQRNTSGKVVKVAIMAGNCSLQS